uniref:Uncharacterized protein n=1 Tax=Oryza punctata TaxID=4537 RepID=A0A0E0KF00_ORYPU
MAFQGVTIVKTATFPGATLFSFGSLKFVANTADQLKQKFCFGSLDFVANNAGVLKLRLPAISPHAPPPAMIHPTSFGISNLTTKTANELFSKIAHTYNPSDDGKQHSATKMTRAPWPFKPEIEAKILEREEEEHRIKQQQEDLQRHMEELCQRGRTTRDAIL